MIYVSYSVYIGNHPEGHDGWSDDPLSLAARAAWRDDRPDLAKRIERGMRRPKNDGFSIKSWYAVPSKKRLLAWWKTTFDYTNYQEYKH